MCPRIEPRPGPSENDLVPPGDFIAPGNGRGQAGFGREQTGRICGSICGKTGTMVQEVPMNAAFLTSKNALAACERR
jgi:hypothetical protein